MGIPKSAKEIIHLLISTICGLHRSKMGSLKYIALGVLLFAIVIHARILQDEEDEENVVEEKSMEDRNMEDNVEADDNANANTVLDALRRVIEKELPEEKNDMEKREPDPYYSRRGRSSRRCNYSSCNRRRRRGGYGK